MRICALGGLAGDGLQVVRCKAVQLRSFELHVDVSEMHIEGQKELRGLHMQGGDDAFHIGQRHIALTPLHTTHVAAIQAAVMRKTFLRKPRTARTASPKALSTGERSASVIGWLAMGCNGYVS